MSQSASSEKEESARPREPGGSRPANHALRRLRGTGGSGRGHGSPAPWMSAWHQPGSLFPADEGGGDVGL